MSNNTIDTMQNQDGSYSPTTMTEYNEPMIEEGKQIANAVAIVANEVIQATNILDNVTKKSENAIQRHYNTQANFNQIVNNFGIEYSNLANREQSILSHINNSNYPCGLWQHNNIFYYRPSQDLELFSGNSEYISEKISSRYPENISIISDLNTIPNNIKEIKFNTISISKKTIIAIEGEVVNTLQEYEIFQDLQGRYWRNLIVNTDYLKNRFISYSLNLDESSKTKYFVQRMTTIKDALFLLNRLGKFFKFLRGENLIVMIGNKNVSEDIFWNKIITTMVNYTNYITLTDDVLKEMSIDDILKGKIIIHIDHIPQSQEHREKLKDILIQVLINRSFQVDNIITPTFAQVIVTLDEAEPFIKDFEHMSDIFYIESLNDILTNLNTINDVALISEISKSLINFSKELSAIGTVQLETNNYSTGNKIFLSEVKDLEISTEIISDIGLPLFDPYKDSYETIISNINRFKHTYIIANQGSGKSQLIISLICRDILLNDCSVVLLDPHGDLAEDILKIIKDKERLVYIDLYLDNSRMPTINLFDIVDNDDEESIYNVTQLIMSVFKNISSEDKLTGAMENIAENCISVMLRDGGGSFWELYQFLGANSATKWINLGKNSPNPLEADFFNNEFGNETNTRNALRRRLSKLIRDPKFNAFMNRGSTFNLEQLVNTKGKIIIFNIASGRMPNTYQYYMKFLVGYLQLIALKRVSIAVDKRIYTQLYLDEFHLFLDKSKNLEVILTGARKYRMFLTFAHQSIAQIENSNMKEILTTIPTRYFIGNVANRTVEILDKALNTKLDNPENLLSGEFYFQEDNNKSYKIQNTDRFLNGKEDTPKIELEQKIHYQLDKYYESLKPTTSKPTEDELKQMIQQFKSDIISKNLTKSSCLYKLKTTAPERFKEIESDFEYKTIRDNEYKPRMRRPEINIIFKLAFELDNICDNSEFTQMLKGNSDMFEQTSNGTRSKHYGNSNGSEQYYYFKWE